MDILSYAALWLSFGAAHSVLTQPNVKERLHPILGINYRLAYNIFSVVHVGLVLLIGRQILDGTPAAFANTPIVSLALNALVLGGVVLMLLSLRQYDLGSFSGLSQFKSGKPDHLDQAPEPLNTSGLNAWVRHPLYSGAFMFLWGGATSSFGFWTALFASAYFIIGTKFEERKLVRLYGDAYRQYQESVSMYFPWKRMS